MVLLIQQPKTSIEQLTTPAIRTRFRETSLPGLVLEITPKGIKTFQVYKQLKNKPVKVTLGRHPDISVEQARKLAARALNQISEGINPNEQERANKRSSITLRDAFEAYIYAHSLREGTLRDHRSIVRKHLKERADKPLLDINQDFVKSKHSKMSKVSPSQADLALRVLRAVFNFAKQEYRGANDELTFALYPVEILSHQRRGDHVAKRTTRITRGQLPAQYKAVQDVREIWDAITQTVCDLVELGIVTGIRRSELLGLTCGTVNLNEKTYYINETKNGLLLELPIPNHVHSIFKRRIALKDSKGFVFSADNKRGVVREPKKNHRTHHRTIRSKFFHARFGKDLSHYCKNTWHRELHY